MAEINHRQEPEIHPANPEGNGSQPPSREKELGNQSPANHAASRKAAGPRTAQGKDRSKLNALKHGLLSKVILLKGESPTEYDSLLNGLLEDLQPQGKLETVFVENLAAVWWGKRRLFQAENAVVTEKIEFIERDSEAKRRDEASEGSRTAIASTGLLRHMINLDLVREAKELLVELRRNVVARNVEGLPGLLKQLYGKDLVGRIPEILRPVSGPPIDSSKIVVDLIDRETERLTKLEKVLVPDEPQRLEYRKSAAVIPCQEVSDHLLRYETHFSREIDRILNRLDRFQRMRKGQPLPPQVDVNIS